MTPPDRRRTIQEDQAELRAALADLGRQSGLTPFLRRCLHGIDAGLQRFPRLYGWLSR